MKTASAHRPATSNGYPRTGGSLVVRIAGAPLTGLVERKTQHYRYVRNDTQTCLLHKSPWECSRILRQFDSILQSIGGAISERPLVQTTGFQSRTFDKFDSSAIAACDVKEVDGWAVRQRQRARFAGECDLLAFKHRFRVVDTAKRAPADVIDGSSLAGYRGPSSDDDVDRGEAARPCIDNAADSPHDFPWIINQRSSVAV